MREATYLKKVEERFNKFVEAMNRADEERTTTKFYDRKTIFIYKNYRDGVLFGDNVQISYIKDRNILSTYTRGECNALQTLFDTQYNDLLDLEEAVVIEGSTTQHKKVLKLVSRNHEVYLDKRLVADYPKGARFFVRKANAPVVIEYCGEIIQIVFPFIGADGFKAKV